MGELLEDKVGIEKKGSQPRIKNPLEYHSTLATLTRTYLLNN
jgi:hypothetical protein